jgi:hypothetical protein
MQEGVPSGSLTDRASPYPAAGLCCFRRRDILSTHSSTESKGVCGSNAKMFEKVCILMLVSHLWFRSASMDSWLDLANYWPLGYVSFYTSYLDSHDTSSYCWHETVLAERLWTRGVNVSKYHLPSTLPSLASGPFGGRAISFLKLSIQHIFIIRYFHPKISRSTCFTFSRLFPRLYRASTIFWNTF